MRVTAALQSVLLCGVCLAASAQTTTYTIGVEDLDYYPLHTTTHTNQYAGYARDVLDAFAQQHGFRFLYLPLPINRLFTVFRTEMTLDFKYPDNPNWQPARLRDASIVYSAPLVHSEEGALVLPAHKGRALDQIKTLGTVLGFTPAPYLPAIAAKTISLSTAASFEGLLRHVMADHLDAVYINVDVAAYLLSEKLKAPSALVFDPGLPHVRSDFSLSSRQHPDVIAQFNLFLQQQRPLLQQLRAKYRIVDAGPH